MEKVNHILIKFNNNLPLFGFYVIYAGIATLVDIGILYMSISFLNLHYLFGGFIGYLSGMSTNFYLNKYYNFKNKSKNLSLQFSLFASIALVGLFLNQAILFFLVDYKNIWYIHAKLVSVSIVMFWSFTGHKFVTFKLVK